MTRTARYLVLIPFFFALLSGCTDSLVDAGDPQQQEDVSEQTFIQNPAPEPFFEDGSTAGKNAWVYVYSAWYKKYYWYQHFYDKGYCDVKYGIIVGCYYYSDTY